MGCCNTFLKIGKSVWRTRKTFIFFNKKESESVYWYLSVDTTLRQPLQMMRYEVKMRYMGVATMMEGFKYVFQQKILTETKREKTVI